MLNRRDFIKASATTGSLLFLQPMSAWAKALAPADDHFFLHLLFPGGFDWSYLFDARPLVMTANNKIQNYLGTDPGVWDGLNGNSTWATSKTDILKTYKNDFSVLNGVLMTPTFDGHQQNLNFLLSGNPLGGPNFMPHLNTIGSKMPLDGVYDGYFSPDQTNLSNFVPLKLEDARTLSKVVKAKNPLEPSQDVWKFISSRYQAAAQGAGAFSLSSSCLFDSVPKSANLESLIRSLDLSQDSAVPFLTVAGEFFKKQISKCAVIVEDLSQEGMNIDAHAASDAKRCPQFAEYIAQKFADTLKYLKTTPYDDTRSLFDVTTVMVSSEFMRTMLQKNMPIDGTGTDHNNYSNTILLGGRGIKGGHVIGQSDFRTFDEKLSQAHIEVDHGQVRCVGRPFDFSTMSNRSDLPVKFQLSDYLTIGSVINSIYKSFGVDTDYYRNLDRNVDTRAPVLDRLLS